MSDLGGPVAVPTVTEARTVSVDGTPIAYEQRGSGPPLIVVDGAGCHRASGPARPLAALLAAELTVYTYDRRGLGASGDTSPYDRVCEVEDLAAVIEAAGGSAYLYGISCGALLALQAAACRVTIPKLALFEPPLRDLTIAEETTVDLARGVTVPTLVIESEGTTGDLPGWAAALVAALPDGRHVRLAGERHDVAAEVLAPVLLDFLRD